MSFPITCTACHKTFTISDEIYEKKVAGRIVTIKCKSCGHGIRVDGSKGAAGASPSTPSSAASAPVAAPAEPLWAVDYPDGQDREFTTQEVIAELERGVVTGQTLIWRDGMAEWLELAQVAELAADLARVEAKAKADAEAKAKADAEAKAKADAEAKAKADAEAKARTAADAKAKANADAKAKAASLVHTPRAPMPTVSGLGGSPSPAAPKPRTTLGSSPDVKLKTSPLGSSPDIKPKASPLGSSPDIKPKASLGSSPDIKPKASLGSSPDITPRVPRASSSDITPRAALGSSPEITPRVPLGSSPELKESALSAVVTPPAAPVVTPPVARIVTPPAPPVVTPPPAVVAPPPAVAAPAVLPTPAAFPGFRVAAADAPTPPLPASVAQVVSKPAQAPPAAPSFPMSTSPAPTFGTLPAVVADHATVEWPEAKKKTPLIVLGVVALAALGGVVFAVSRKDDVPPPPPLSAIPTATSSPTTAAPPAVPAITSQPGAETASGSDPVVATPGAGFAELFAAGARKAESKGASVAPTARFDPSATKAPLAQAATDAQACKQSGGPSGKVTVMVTFDPNGKAAGATITDAPFAGTATASCITAAMKRASIPPFSGLPGTVSKTFTLL